MPLHARLFLSYAAVILLALVLAGAAAIVLRWRAERQAALDRLIVAAPQLMLDVFRLRREGASQEQVTAALREEARQRGVRVLLVDRSSTVTVDTGDTLRGRRLHVPREAGRRGGPPAYRVWEGRGPEQRGLLFLTVSGPLDRVPGAGPLRGGPPAELSDRVVLAVPRQTVARAWLGLLPGLAWAGLIALALSAVVAVLLSRSIARPLQALTRASEEMARGNYDQAIPLRRNDEVGRLAAAFNEMARQVGRSHLQMRRLIANVSHDLKTPLTSILGFAQALRDGAVAGPEQAAETGAIIHAEAERVQALVDDLLYLSEIEAGQVVLAREAVDLGALAGRAARRFAPALHERGVELAVALPGEGIHGPPLVVNGDGARLERVLDNLLDNARKYTPAGGRVEVRGRPAPGTPAAVRLEVFNSGSLIPPADLPRVFERFYRLDRARTRTSGSGLGLAIAKELVELHGGALTVASDAPGTTFTLTLPGAATAGVPNQPPPPAPERPAGCVAREASSTQPSGLRNHSGDPRRQVRQARRL